MNLTTRQKQIGVAVVIGIGLLVLAYVTNWGPFSRPQQTATTEPQAKQALSTPTATPSLTPTPAPTSTPAPTPTPIQLEVTIKMEAPPVIRLEVDITSGQVITITGGIEVPRVFTVSIPYTTTRVITVAVESSAVTATPAPTSTPTPTPTPLLLPIPEGYKDVTSELALTVSANGKQAENLRDRKVETVWDGGPVPSQFRFVSAEGIPRGITLLIFIEQNPPEDRGYKLWDTGSTKPVYTWTPTKDLSVVQIPGEGNWQRLAVQATGSGTLKVIEAAIVIMSPSL